MRYSGTITIEEQNMGYGLLICLGIIIGVCLKIHSMSFMKKLAVKIVLVYVMMGWLALCIYMV